MPHAFSVEIQDYLSKKILLAREAQERATRESEEALHAYYEGQLLELTAMRRYLTDNIDLKTQKYY